MASAKKPILFFIHGLRGSHDGLRFIAEKLEKDFHIINEDLPGSGSNPELPVQDLAHYIEYLHDAISKLPDKPILIGHSFGSIIASHYAEKYPKDTAKKIVLLSPILRSRAKKPIDRALYMILRTTTSPLPKSRKHKLLASKPVSLTISRVLTHNKSMQEEIDHEHLTYSHQFASARSLLGDAKISMTTETIIPRRKDVLAIIGEFDQLTKSQHAKRHLENRVDFHIQNGTGHLLNYEKPTEIADAIRVFAKTF